MNPLLTRRRFLYLVGAVAGSRALPSFAAADAAIAPQPYFAGVLRAVDELARLGSPVSPEDARALAALASRADDAAVAEAEALLNRYTLARVAFNPAAGVPAVAAGGARPVLVEQGWRMFLVRVSNPRGRVEPFTFTCNLLSRGPGNLSASSGAARAFLPDTLNMGPSIEKLWLFSKFEDTTPLYRYQSEIPTLQLTGIPVEYRVIELFSRDAGANSHGFQLVYFPNYGARIDEAGHGSFSFETLPSRIVSLGVLDADGTGCVASLTFRDAAGRVYPPAPMRLAPDMFFHDQVYRGDGESMRLPDGEYVVESRRGPEYLVGRQNVTIGAGRTRIDVRLARWIDPSRWGWYSGDTHIHAGGCLHYQCPTEGVSPETMIRHVRGEGLSVGDVLSWGPSWYYQKQFFTGRAQSPAASLEHPELQAANHASLAPHGTPKDADSLLRYDVEVSGFPSSHAGHLVLLRLSEQDYPGTKAIEDWPSWNLPILRWARSQGAYGGYAHCGLGMFVESGDLPNFQIPPMDGIGTQEAIVDATHGLVDFLSGCDTWPVAELNAWYHMLNCGFRMCMVGETDYPCISGDRPGIGRSYVRLDARPQGNAGYEAWISAMRQGRLYCGDGRSHVLEFTVGGRRPGDADLALDGPRELPVEALVAARLEPTVPPDMDEILRSQLNRWHLERARLGSTRTVAVELVVNGRAVDRAVIEADGEPRPVRFTARIERSSWVALRILPSSHTHPVFAAVAGKPLRASRLSARWCSACVDKLWEVKAPFMRESERPAAKEAFDHARAAYDAIAGECEVDG